jgi:hemolysin III
MEQTRNEELVNTLTHVMGMLLSIGGSAVLIVFAVLRGTVWHVVACSVYGASLIAMFAASSIYHHVSSPRIKHILNIVDHSAIYLLIAGTYTPFTLTVLRGGLGWTLFGLVWGCAVVGIAVKTVFIGRWRLLSTALYVLLGWLCVVAFKPLYAGIDAGGFVLLLSGGAAYTLGVIFYLWHRLPYNHAVWHVFVLAGGILQYLSVLLYVVPLMPR